MVEDTKTKFQLMQEFAAETFGALEDRAFSVLERSIYDLMATTNSLKDAWVSAWDMMRQAALQAMSEIIAQMIRTMAINAVCKSVLGLFGAGTGAAVLPTGAADLLPTGGYASINPSIGGLPTGGTSGNMDLLSAINGLRSDLAANANPTFNLSMDGVPLRNALKRVEGRLNVLSANV